MPKPDVSAERIPLILNSAIKVFSKKGFEAARMEDIAKTAKLSVGGVYWYYKSKEEIIIAIMEQLIDKDVKDLRALLEAEGSVRARLEAYISLSIEAAQEYIPITYELYSLAHRNAKVKNHIRAFLQTYHSVLEQFIQQGIDRKEFKSANAREAALTLASLYEGTLELTMLDPERVDAKKTLLGSFKLLMNGFANK
ncbi:MAG: TetR/AcrR family transcriptional regulator [Anaerolineales bacterium]|uniref:TetR/AcrR family transcriptional regulator n=1 Tax=Candidatus Villigracilis vicinus TaxID=3140679 RepID=UPI003134EC06|nr:TetR/AcrR family transcriptional regulator [Anaerolineales bacterium]